MLYISPLGMEFWKQVCQECLEGWDSTTDSRHWKARLWIQCRSVLLKVAPDSCEYLLSTPSRLCACGPFHTPRLGMASLQGFASDLSDPTLVLVSFPVRGQQVFGICSAHLFSREWIGVSLFRAVEAAI